MAINEKELRKFGLVLGLTLIGIAGYYALKDRFIPVLVILAHVICIVALDYPKALSPVKWIWDIIGVVLGTINTNVLLIVVYYAIITPIGLIMRLLGNDALKRKPQKLTATYWEPVPATEANSMERQF